MSEPGYLSHPTFRQWLAYAAKDEAKAWHEVHAWFLTSCHCGLRARTLRGVLQHMRGHEGEEKPTLRMMRRAFRDYVAFLKSGESIARGIGPPRLPPGRKRQRASYALPPTTIAQVQKLCDTWGVRSQAEVIRIAVAIAANRNPKRPPAALL